tara:strand:+ start:635 stop:1147 length:513 start_codon:yes stop_codon:yes gene_type:complete
MKKQRYKKTNTLDVGTMVQGMIGENNVSNLFLKNGYIVTRPDVDLGVDMVVCKPKKWGKRFLMNKWKSIQVKYHTRVSETTYGKSLRVKVTPNHCDYIAIPLDEQQGERIFLHINTNRVLFYPQPKDMKGKEYVREFAFYDSSKVQKNGNFFYKNQNKRRWAKDFYELPN